MNTKTIPRLFCIVMLLMAASYGFSQVVPAAKSGRGSLPLVFGGGYSNFSMDWGPGHRSNGIYAYVDVYPFPAFLHDVGIELEGRSSRWGNPIPNLREDTGMIGGIYSYSHLQRIRPYGKFLAGIGSMDFPAFPSAPKYTHDTFFADAAAGGADVQLYEGIWVRGEYQYQWWHNVFGGHTYTPNGISVGLHYDFRSIDLSR